jgi:hypothetical protein
MRDMTNVVQQRDLRSRIDATHEAVDVGFFEWNIVHWVALGTQFI